MMLIRKQIAALTLGLALSVGVAGPAIANGYESVHGLDSNEVVDSEKQKIVDVLKSYEAFANESDYKSLGALYTEESILLPDRFDVFVGMQNITGFYQYAFSALTLDLVFNIDPANIVVSGDTAYATTDSTGTRYLKETGRTVPEINRELWVFEKVDGEWKIARYCFNKSE